MRHTIEFLDAIKASNGGASDYKIAKILGVKQQTVSRWRTGRDFLGDSTAIRAAELLKIDPAYVVACCHAERSKAEPERAVWVSIVERLGHSISKGLQVVSPAPLGAENSPKNAETICIM